MSDENDDNGGDLPELRNQLPDYIASLVRAGLGPVPIFGAAMVEAVTMAIPGQRLDRVADFVTKLAERMNAVEDELRQRAAERVRTNADAAGLVEEAFLQAVRARSEDRRGYIASLLARGLTAQDFAAAEAETMLRLLGSLSDGEVVHLAYLGMDPTLGSGGADGDFYRRHEQTLRPASREMDSTAEEEARAAVEDAYSASLARLGLVREEGEGRRREITPLGRHLLRWIEAPGEG
jgi:hypothetical protein